jgi:hypothetical protein
MRILRLAEAGPPLVFAPLCVAIPSCCMAMTVSSRVKSGCSAINPSNHGACASKGDVLPPPGLAAALPIRRKRCIQRIAELTLTANCSAASPNIPIVTSPIRAAWAAHLEKLGIAALKVNPDPTLIATEGALWGSVKAHGFLREGVIVSDDAGQFKVGQRGLCRVHAERLVHKLDTFTDQNRAAQSTMRAAIWQLDSDLKAYRCAPTAQRKADLEASIAGKTGFITLDRPARTTSCQQGGTAQGARPSDGSALCSARWIAEPAPDDGVRMDRVEAVHRGRCGASRAARPGICRRCRCPESRSRHQLLIARLHQLRGVGNAKVLKSLGRSSKGRHYRG